MTHDDRLEMKKYNITLTEKQQKFQQYFQIKLMNTTFLQVK